MDVSVVIPTTLSRPALLREAVLSVTNQVHPPDELLVVVDSSDRSTVCPEDLGIASPTVPVIFVHTDVPSPRGVSAARNLGARLARGTYVAFLDDDDYWLPSFLETFLYCPPDVGLAAFLKLGQDGRITAEKIPPACLHPRRFFVCNPGLRGSNLFIRRSLLHDVGGFQEALPSMNDVDLGVRLSRMKSVDYRRVTTPLVVFRSHRGNRVTTPHSDSIASGVMGFWTRHASAMNPRERELYWLRAAELWGLQPPAPKLDHD